MAPSYCCSCAEPSACATAQPWAPQAASPAGAGEQCTHSPALTLAKAFLDPGTLHWRALFSEESGTWTTLAAPLLATLIPREWQGVSLCAAVPGDSNQWILSEKLQLFSVTSSFGVGAELAACAVVWWGSGLLCVHISRAARDTKAPQGVVSSSTDVTKLISPHLCTAGQPPAPGTAPVFVPSPDPRDQQQRLG